MKNYRYTFRFCCDPGYNDKAELAALYRFVGEAGIDDVAVFANVEEINTGHMSFEEQDVYIALMKQVKSLMAEKGVTMSVNQWHSVMHADIGKQLRAEQGFRLMVDIEGNESKLCVCPLCETWLSYIAQLYARYAELNPEILWVEDDFRLHNHAPLVWGGCFCDEHMRIYSRRAGKQLTREEFLAGVLQPGKPHPYRKIWLDVAGDTMVNAANVIGKAVREKSVTAKVGLMSSVPHIHAAEGRRWHDILNGFAAGRPSVNRIHLPGYSEIAPCEYIKSFNMVSMLTRAMIPKDCEVYPELENFPFSRYSKSRRFTRFQLLSSLSLSLSGITIDLYDLNGSGIVWSEGYQDTLRDTKPFLNELNSSGVFSGIQRGVHVMYSEGAAYNLHTGKGEGMEELYPHEVFFAGLLPLMGVPCVFCDNPDISGEIVAISGQYLRNLTLQQITMLFENNFVILNGDSAAVLIEMGLGGLAGIKNAHWEIQDTGAFAFEQVTNGESYCGLENARSSAVIVCANVLFCEYEGKFAEYTAMHDSYRRRRAHGQVVYNNKVLIYPYGGFTDPIDVPVMLRNTMRAEIIHDILKKAGAGFPIIENAPYLVPYCYEVRGKQYLYLVNASTDDTLAAKISGTTRFASIRRSNSTQITGIDENSGNYPINIPSMETALLSPESEVLQ